jgi:S-formylglutathione hydrolase
MALEIVSKVKSFGGYQKVYRHFSSELQCSMKFSLYEPPGAGSPGSKFNVLYYLSGLTCSEENFIQKSGFQKYASEHGFIVVGPDTSPRKNAKS